MKQVITYQVKDLSKQSREQIFDWLLKDSKAIKLFSNLDDDVSKLLKYLKLTSKQLEDLAEVKKCVVDKQYVLMYIPGKWFSIDKGYGSSKVWTGFSDLAQYGDATGEEVYQAYLDLGFNPNNLISPSNVYRKETLDKLDLPKYEDIPEDAMQIAYECCKGNWVEAFSIGKWDKVFDYDINSAYPYQASKLLDLRLGTWTQSKEYQKNATYGYCRCEVSIDSDFSPIIKSYEDRNYTPKGVFETSLTKAEIDFIEQWNLGFVTILDGWWWTIKNGAYSANEINPLYEPINKLYKQKQESTGIKRDIIKRIMAGSFYGVFIEFRGEDFGDLFMAPYAAEIESGTRLQMADWLMSSNVKPLQITVDGFITGTPIMTGKTTDDIGDIRLEHENVPAIICSSGLSCIQGKHGEGNFSVEYQWLLDRINSKPDATEFEMQQKQILTLAQAKQLGRIQDIGTEETITRTIEIGDNKREYEHIPETFGELIQGQYRSTAWDAETLDILENTDIGEDDGDN